MTETAPHKVRMGEITAAEARSLYALNPVVLLPFGSHEDQGPHAPMGDYLLAEKVAEAIALRATAAGTRTVVAPVMPFGRADFFAPMPGGIALSHATLLAVLEEVLGALLRHGLTNLVILNGHGGNVPVIEDATRRIHHAGGPAIPCLYLWRIAGGLLPRILGEEKARMVAGHGADPLTSLGLHYAPERMRPELTPAPRPGPSPTHLGIPFKAWGALDFQGAEVTVPLDYDQVSPDAVSAGDPRLCTAETGAALAEMLATIGADFCAHLVAARKQG